MTARRYGMKAGLTPRAAVRWMQDTATAAGGASHIRFSVHCFTHPIGATFAPFAAACGLVRNAEDRPGVRFNLCAWKTN